MKLVSKLIPLSLILTPLTVHAVDSGDRTYSSVSGEVNISRTTTLEVDKVSFLGLLSPLVALFAGYLVLEQTFTAIQYVGIGFVFLSIYLANQNRLPQLRFNKLSKTLTAGELNGM